MATSRLARKFWQDGFLVLEDYFEDTLMAELDRLIRDHFGDDPGFEHSDEFLSEAKTEVVPWFPQNDGPGAFDKIDSHDALNELTGAILGEGWRRDYCMVMFSKRGSAGQAWHQDCPPDNPNQFNINRLVYTSDISDETGGQTVVVPRSHKKGMLPAGDPAGHFDGEVVLRPRKGTLVLLHGHTWHRVLPVADKCRYSANYRAVTRDTRKDITDICVYRNMRYQFSTSSIVEKRI